MKRDGYKFMWFIIYMIMLSIVYKFFSGPVFAIYIAALILSHLAVFAKDFILIHKSMVTLIEMLNEYFSERS